VEPALWDKPLRGRDGDRFLLCSDGLHDLVADAEILDAVTGRTPDDACAALVELAKSRGGHDNITVGVLFLALEASFTKKSVRETREVTVM
jgi:protein phosphatase